MQEKNCFRDTEWKDQAFEATPQRIVPITRPSTDEEQRHVGNTSLTEMVF